ncbi:MAG: hypothetical protein Q8K73_03560, partial [Anaerolineales bacterium]|nr:hypothetical protein [Anaerolineales bacterium]
MGIQAVEKDFFGKSQVGQACNLTVFEDTSSCRLQTLPTNTYTRDKEIFFGERMNDQSRRMYGFFL